MEVTHGMGESDGGINRGFVIFDTDGIKGGLVGKWWGQTTDMI